MENITLKTLKRIQEILKNSEIPLSAGYIAKKHKIHPNRTLSALHELINQGVIRKIPNSTGVALYEHFRS